MHRVYVLPIFQLRTQRFPAAYVCGVFIFLLHFYIEKFHIIILCVLVSIFFLCLCRQKEKRLKSVITRIEHKIPADGKRQRKHFKCIDAAPNEVVAYKFQLIIINDVELSADCFSFFLKNNKYYKTRISKWDKGDKAQISDMWFR